MPTYQYSCTQCGHALEVVQAFTDTALSDCPECSGRLRKVYSAVGVVFKGSGFYRTDSRKAASTGSPSSGASTGGSSGPAGGSGGSSTGGSTEGAGGSSGSVAASTATKTTSTSSGESAA